EAAIVDVACGDVDDAAPAGLLHVAGRPTPEEELGAQIGVEGGDPVLVLVFVDLLADEERGVIDENVDPVMAGDYLGDEAVAGAAPADIGDDRLSPRAPPRGGGAPPPPAA